MRGTEAKSRQQPAKSNCTATDVFYMLGRDNPHSSNVLSCTPTRLLLSSCHFVMATASAATAADEQLTPPPRMISSSCLRQGRHFDAPTAKLSLERTRTINHGQHRRRCHHFKARPVLWRHLLAMLTARTSPELACEHLIIIKNNLNCSFWACLRLEQASR